MLTKDVRFQYMGLAYLGKGFIPGSKFKSTGGPTLYDPDVKSRSKQSSGISEKPYPDPIGNLERAFNISGSRISGDA